MEIFVVGGCVRDVLLGRQPKDIDYVVLGATVQEMLNLGYSQVGADFPVFLHPVTGDEYALARKERKIDEGYHGFEVTADASVTLLEDLKRRDLTMNAMAVKLANWDDFVQTANTNHVIDPYGGMLDLNNEVIRHVSEAFAEDPVRVLRAARFAARYRFTVSPQTINLMKIVAPELDHVSPERIFLEFQKGLMEDHSYLMYEALIASGAFDVKALRPYHTTLLTARRPPPASWKLLTFEQRFAYVALNFYDKDYETHRIPSAAAHLAKSLNANADYLLAYWTMTTEAKLKMFTRLRVYSDPHTFRSVGAVIQLMYGWDMSQFFKDIERAKSVDAQEIAASCAPKDIPKALFEARKIALERN